MIIVGMLPASPYAAKYHPWDHLILRKAYLARAQPRFMRHSESLQALVERNATKIRRYGLDGLASLSASMCSCRRPSHHVRKQNRACAACRDCLARYVHCTPR
ncbi:hypothetical protein IG631_14081 [Alternaria alternata]|nr:hypothetical protein IG631_14081 [Alternaria alternata]